MAIYKCELVRGSVSAASAHLVLDGETLRVVVPHLVGLIFLSVVKVRRLGGLVPVPAGIRLQIHTAAGETAGSSESPKDLDRANLLLQ